MKQSLFVLISMLCSFGLFAQESRDVTLSGKVYRPHDTLVLTKHGGDVRYQGVEIPIRADSTFEYTFSYDYIEEYQLAFRSELNKGSWMPIRFFTEGNEIQFTLYPQEQFEKNVVEGSSISKQQLAFYEDYMENFANRLNKWYGELNAPDQGDSKKEEAKKNIDAIWQEVKLWERDYFLRKPALFGYYEFYSILRNLDNNPYTNDELLDLQKFWTDNYPDHPIKAATDKLLYAHIGMGQGGTYVDIPLIGEDSNDDLSSIVGKHKYTLLDLWSPWCGPCIRKSKKVKELYPQLHNNGLEVVGVIGGVNEVEDYIYAKEKYSYPWSVYREMNNENDVWLKYGIPNAGGGQFLIDSKGKVVAVNPAPETILGLITY